MILKKFLSSGLLLFCGLHICYSQSIPDFFGVTRKGGSEDGGVIYKTDSDLNNYQVVYDFKKNDGKEPNFTYLTEFNGKLYGCTRYGGKYSTGIIFEYNVSSDQYMNLVDMNNSVGSQPWGSLVVANNQKMYGLARYGGSLQKGTLFEYDPLTGIAIKKVDFDGSNKGGEPVGSLCLADDGKLYGLTSIGGTFGQGVLFSFDPDQGTYTKLHNFSGFGFGDGAQPKSDLMQASDGKIYGTTTYGGINDQGTIFEYDILSSTYAVKHSFSALITGKNPWSGKLVEYPAGKLWGMTIVGGTSDFGAIYNYLLSSGAVTKVYNFSGGLNGENPGGGFVIGPDTLLYSMTQKGGINNTGIIFSLNTYNYTFSKKIDFNGVNYGGVPYGSLIKGSDNELYGMTSSGGLYNSGILFKYSNSTNVLTKKHDFGFVGNGFSPVGDLVMAGRDTLYGLTTNGGAQSGGVIFELDVNSGTFKKKFDLSFFYGVYPLNGFCLAGNDLMYATASEGGVSNKGTLFEYNKKTNSIVRYPMNDINGSYPNCKVAESSNGKLYGMTFKGGDFDKGIMFEFNPVSKVLSKIFSFDGPNFGSFPEGDLIERNGKMYGLATKGGANDNGVIFSFDPITYTFVKLYEFSGPDGSAPITSMTEKNGILYGICQKGGINENGVIFKYNILTDEFIKLIDFENISTGSLPNGKLRFSSDTKMNGSTEKGGLYDKGTLFEFDINSNTFQKKLDFDGMTGDGPYHSGLGLSRKFNNNFCFGAINVNLGEGYCNNLLLDNNLETVNSKIGPYPSCGFFAGSDKWYKLIVPASGSIQAEMSKIGYFTDGAMAVYSGSCQSLILATCDDDSNNNPGTDLMPSVSLNGLTPGSEIFLRIWSKNNQKRGEYSFCAWNNDNIAISDGGNCITGATAIADEFYGNLYTWLPLKDNTGKIVAFIYPNGSSLGNIYSKVYTKSTLPLRIDGDNKPYINRDIQIMVDNQPGADSAYIRLCYSATEVNDLILASNSQYSFDDLNATKNEFECSGTFIMPGLFFEQKKNSALNNLGDRYFEFEIPSFSTFYLHGGTSVLPILINNFIGKNMGKFNLIEWEIENNGNIKSISLEKSVTDPFNWDEISEFYYPAINNFSYEDHYPTENSFYRIKIMDETEEIRFSDILNITSDQKFLKDVIVYPNPVSNVLSINLGENSSFDFSATLFNNSGKPLFSGLSDKNTLNIDTSGFLKGIYYIKIFHKNDFFMKKLIVE
jgi:uncharacterized repeat protein (TIGR03803 family)